jgi:hypothetical protein
MKVNFDEDEQDQGGGWVWHYGTLTKDGKDFPFSLLAMAMNVGGMELDPTFEITWVEDEPDNKAEAEELILEEL